VFKSVIGRLGAGQRNAPANRMMKTEELEALLQLLEMYNLNLEAAVIRDMIQERCGQQLRSSSSLLRDVHFVRTLNNNFVGLEIDDRWKPRTAVDCPDSCSIYVRDAVSCF
jgi:hypothetical protein